MGGTADLGPTTEPKYNAFLRANVEKAKSIRCYVDPTTFHRALFADAGGAPPLDQMWYGQVGLWVQQDIVDAIKNLNDAAAKSSGDSDAFVEQMPVKRLISVQVHGYMKADGKLLLFSSSAGAGAGAVEGAMDPSFTQRKSDELFDIVRFSVTAVVDQRQVLQFVESINRTNYYRLLTIGYDAVDRSVDQAVGYL